MQPNHRHPHGRRNALVALNALLLAALGFVHFGTSAEAQNAPPGAQRARGEYTMVSGRGTMGGADVVYVIDSNNQELVALRWEQAKQVLATVGYRTIEGDAQAQPGR